MLDLLRGLDGWVYSLFGADGLRLFNAHPQVFGLAALGLLVLVAALLAMWISRRVRAFLRGLRLAAALTTRAEGRHCLRLARQIRRGGARLRVAIRAEIPDRGERRALLRVLQRFTRTELGVALEHALRLIQAADDRREEALRRDLERQTYAWSTTSDEAERERLQQAIAETRQALARVADANAARTAHLQGLAEAAGAVLELERELGSLHLERSRALPEFRDRLGAVARQVGHLTAAYRELNLPR